MLRGLIAPKVEVRAQATDWGSWPGDVTPTWAGQDVNSNSAMQLLTVYGCVQLITDSISTLPVDCVRTLPTGAKEPVDPPLWLVSPTVDLGFAEWCSQLLVSLLLQGNAYVAVLRNPSGQIVELVPLDPGAVSVRRQAGRKVYVIAGAVYPGEILHVKGLMLPGSDVGYSPIEAARQAIGLGLAATKFGAEFFSGEGNMPGVIEMPKPAQQTTMKDLAEQWRRKRTKGGRGLPGVLDDGATWKPTGVTNEQAQFLATRNYTAAEISGQMFLVDPSDLGIAVSGTSLTYANLEQRNARRLQVTLLRWIIRLEKAISSLLPGADMKFNVEGFLRGDTLSRFQAYDLAAQMGVLTVDEMRQLENFPPLSAEDKKQSRSWQEVGLPALVDGGLMTPNEARAQLGLGPTPGGDKPRDPAALAPGGSNAA